ncbi:MAG: hypothetical protein AAGI72_05545 [Pseudomonadota bacterium]
MRVSRLLRYCVFLPFAFSLISCANTAGKNYTLAKVDRAGYLTDPFEHVGNGWDEHVDSINGNLEIRLADHFLAYLASLGQPELVIFSRATITDPSDRTKQIVFEQILLNTEDQSTYSAGNQGGGGTLKDVVLLPAVKYRNQDIRIELRVVELDSADNERTQSVINQAAQTGGTFKLVAGPEITAIASALNFIVANNTDDIEFSVDIGISPKTPQVQAYNGALTDVVLQPRTGTWVIVKTELPGRLYFAGDTVSVASDSIVWALANTLKLGTLNVANWWNKDKDQSDNYMKLFGNPLGLSSVAVTEPRVKDDKISHYEGHFYTACGSVSNPLNDNVFPLVYKSGSLQVEYPCKGTNSSGEEVTIPRLIPFRDKSYLALTMSSPALAVDAKALASLSSKISDLNIATTQLKGAEFDKELGAVMEAIESIAHVRNAMDVTEDQMASAEDQDTISMVRGENYEILKKKINALDIDEDSKTRILSSARIDMEKAESRAKRNLRISRESNAVQKMNEAGIFLKTASTTASYDPQAIPLESDENINNVLVSSGGVVDEKATASVTPVPNANGHYLLTLARTDHLDGSYELDFFTASGMKTIPIYVSPQACAPSDDIEGVIDSLNADGGPLNTDSHATKSWRVCSARTSSCDRVDLEVGWKSVDAPSRTAEDAKRIVEDELAKADLSVNEVRLTAAPCG